MPCWLYLVAFPHVTMTNRFVFYMESRSVFGHPKRDQHLFLNDFKMSITFAAFDYRWVWTQFNTRYMTGLWAQLINLHVPFPQRIGGGGGGFIHISISFSLITKVSDKFRLFVRVVLHELPVLLYLHKFHSALSKFVSKSEVTHDLAVFSIAGNVTTPIFLPQRW